MSVATHGASVLQTCGFGRASSTWHKQSPLNFKNAPGAGKQLQPLDVPLPHRATWAISFLTKPRGSAKQNIPHSYSGFHFFYAKLWTVAYEKPMVKKVWKKYEKSCGGLPSSPKSKRGGQAFGILAIPTTPIFWGLWGAFSRHVCPVTAGRNDNLAGQRPQTTNSISCTRLARSTAAVASIECTLNSMRDHRLRDHVRESSGLGERRRLMHFTRSGLCSGVASLVKMVKGSVERSRHERHFCSLLPYFLLSWLQIFQLCLSFCTSSPDQVLFKKFLQEK